MASCDTYLLGQMNCFAGQAPVDKFYLFEKRNYQQQIQGLIDIIIEDRIKKELMDSSFFCFFFTFTN